MEWTFPSHRLLSTHATASSVPQRTRPDRMELPKDRRNVRGSVAYTTIEGKVRYVLSGRFCFTKERGTCSWRVIQQFFRP